MRWTVPIAVALTLLPTASGSCLPRPVAAQQTADRSSLWALLLLRGKLVNVSYTPGSLDRAVRVQESFELLAAQFGAWSGSKTPLVIYVINREEWGKVGFALPYGFPARLPARILAVAAWGDEGTVDLWKGLTGGALPEVEPAAVARGTAEETASLRPGDLLGQVEAVRILMEASGVAGAELWISELMAHAVARAAWMRQAPHRAASMDRLEGVWHSASGAPLPLEGYRAGVTMRDWLAYQAAFQSGARQLVEGAGPRSAKALLKMARRGGGRLSAGELFRRFPRLADWHRGVFSTAGGSG